MPLLPQAAGPVWGKSGTLPLLCECIVDLAYSDSVLFVFIFIGFSLATIVRNDVDPVRRLQTSQTNSSWRGKMQFSATTVHKNG